MPTPLPVIRGTSTALFPFTQTYMCLTSKSDAQSSAAIRSVAGLPLLKFGFPYDQLKMADKNTLKAAFVNAKGQFDTSLSATLGSAYTDLSFDADEFASAEMQSTAYGVKWVVTQTLPQNLSPGSPGGAYPTLSTGAICQLPYVQKARSQTIVSKVASGPKYTYAEFGGGLTNFPTGPLMAWEFTESHLIVSEVSAKVAHFLANWGDAYSFTFKDEDAIVYSNVYYASPQLSITWVAPNQATIKTGLIQLS